jgi:hypothetical protein
MAGILTITMNPAIDVSTSVDRVAPTRKLRCTTARRDAGGGGINVGRVASRLGADVTALETATDDQFRFVLCGPRLSDREWQSCLEALTSFDQRPDFIAAGGSLPPGVPEDFYARIAEIARRWAVPLALDSSGTPLKAAVDHGVDLLKPNLRELQELTGELLADRASSTPGVSAFISGVIIFEETLKQKTASGILLPRGEPAFDRVDAPATPELSTLSPQQVRSADLAGEKIQSILTRAPGNGAPIGGLKVIAENGWFAARPSGTEDIYKIYAESFRGEYHLRRIAEEAQAIVDATLGR